MMLSAPPSFMLSISIEPLSRSIAALARNIPRPILSFRLEIKGSPSFSITSLGIPGPSSLIQISNLKGDSLVMLKWTTTLLCAALMAFSIILITACLTLRFEVTTDSDLSLDMEFDRRGWVYVHNIILNVICEGLERYVFNFFRIVFIVIEIKLRKRIFTARHLLS